SGNTTGVSMASGSTFNGVFDNLIGTNAAGTAAIANGTGVFIASGCSWNVIGDADVLTRSNLISGNAAAGIEIQGDNNYVKNNFIGTDTTGTSSIFNGDGISLRNSGAKYNQIGGSIAAGASNLISGNGD